MPKFDWHEVMFVAFLYHLPSQAPSWAGSWDSWAALHSRIVCWGWRTCPGIFHLPRSAPGSADRQVSSWSTINIQNQSQSKVWDESIDQFKCLSIIWVAVCSFWWSGCPCQNIQWLKDLPPRGRVPGRPWVAPLCAIRVISFLAPLFVIGYIINLINPILNTNQQLKTTIKLVLTNTLSINQSILISMLVVNVKQNKFKPLIDSYGI